MSLGKQTPEAAINYVVRQNPTKGNKARNQSNSNKTQVFSNSCPPDKPVFATKYNSFPRGDRRIIFSLPSDPQVLKPLHRIFVAFRRDYFCLFGLRCLSLFGCSGSLLEFTLVAILFIDTHGLESETFKTISSFVTGNVYQGRYGPSIWQIAGQSDRGPQHGDERLPSGICEPHQRPRPGSGCSC